MTTMTLADVGALARAIRAEVSKAVVGQADTVDALLVALLVQPPRWLWSSARRQA